MVLVSGNYDISIPGEDHIHGPPARYVSDCHIFSFLTEEMTSSCDSFICRVQTLRGSVGLKLSQGPVLPTIIV